jgi:hypothetical protein
MDIDEILDGFELPERTVPVCLKGSLVAEYEELERQLPAASRDGGSLSEPSEAVTIARRMEALRQEIAASSWTFRFRALPGTGYEELQRRHPPRKDKQELFNAETFPIALISACCADPPMTEDHVRRFKATVSDKQYWDVYDTAVAVNRASVDVPFSKLAFDVLQGSEPS